MNLRLIIFIIVLLFFGSTRAQNISRFIIIDQFGYLPEAKKIAVLKDPQTGFDASESFSPGLIYSVINANTGEKVYTADRTIWGNGTTDASSGDKTWHFDFTPVSEPGTYYILDEEKNLKSYEFMISPNVYNEILRQAMRSFFYQRSGFKKEAQYAGEEWADSASHIGNLQDKNCRYFFDKANPDLEKDVSGGWYDAGDYNKYTNWTANYIVELMKAYLEKPEAWADDYDIPESGNGIPDILDETKWGVDHLLRLQQLDGSVLSIVGESHASPPSAVTGPSYYGDASTSATSNTAAAFAICSKVYRSFNMDDYADTLLVRAIRAWNWAEENPAVIFNNNDASNNSVGLGAGNQEVNDYDRGMIMLEAACYLLEVTGDVKYHDYFDAHYQDCHLMMWNWAYPFEALNQEVLLYYTKLAEGTKVVQDSIKYVYNNAVVYGSDNLTAYKNQKDPYMAYIKDYTWGSNGIKSAQGNMYYNLITFNIDETSASIARDAALTFVNYIHGVNPLNFVYLSNMYHYGAENGVNEFYHSWFCNGSIKWDRVGTSTSGPPPGYLTGGPNPSYNWDGCCPSGCGSTANNAICNSESISPPKNQPAQKSYKDFNTSWPLNSWEITENSCGYQVNYIRLLSKFVTSGLDCNGEENGSAFFDSCGVCAGGNTGIIPVLDRNECSFPVDCYGEESGIAFIDSCGICAGGNTGIVPILDTNDCVIPVDCNGDENGLAFADSCDVCAGGNTGISPILDAAECPNTSMKLHTNIEPSYISIFPNPNNGLLYIDCKEQFPFQIVIIDLVGKIIAEGHYSGNTTINTNQLQPGYYEVIVKIRGEMIRQKLIKL
jgi:endoglucanase